MFFLWHDHPLIEAWLQRWMPSSDDKVDRDRESSSRAMRGILGALGGVPWLARTAQCIAYQWPTTEHRYTSSVTTMLISGFGPAAAASTSSSEWNWCGVNPGLNTMRFCRQSGLNPSP